MKGSNMCFFFSEIRRIVPKISSKPHLSWSFDEFSASLVVFVECCCCIVVLCPR